MLIAIFHNPVQAAQSVTLAWDRSPDMKVVGYRVYYGVASRIYTNMISVGNATNATITKLVEGATYHFACTAYDSLGLESIFSDEVRYTVPATIVRLLIRTTPDRQIILTVAGPIGHTNDILATQDLRTWTVIGTVTMGAGGSLDFTDTNAVSSPKRFYRTRAVN